MKYVYFVSGRFSNMDVHFDCTMTSNLMIADDTRLKELRKHIFNTLSDSKEKSSSNASDYVRINTMSFLHTIDE